MLRADLDAARMGRLLPTFFGLDEPSTLSAIAEGIRDAFAAEAAVVALRDPSAATLSVKAVAFAQDAPQGSEPREIPLPLSEPSCPEVFFVSDCAADNLSAWPSLNLLFEAFPCRCAIVACLRNEGELLGVAAVLFEERYAYHDEMLDLFGVVANAASTALANTRQQGRAQGVARIEERTRLAREMHDGVAQNLSYIHFKTVVTEGLLASKDLGGAADSLRELEKTVMQFLNEVREDVFGLRVTDLLRHGFVCALQELVAAYRERHGMDARFFIEGGRTFEPSLSVAANILRIVQEALANAQKHAGASRVTVEMLVDKDVSISVSDDGCGFTLSDADIGSEHFGLQMMRERAASFGGRLEIHSEPGCGTEVTIHVPIDVREGNVS